MIFPFHSVDSPSWCSVFYLKIGISIYMIWFLPFWTQLQVRGNPICRCCMNGDTGSPIFFIRLSYVGHRFMAKIKYSQRIYWCMPCHSSNCGITNMSKPVQKQCPITVLIRKVQRYKKVYQNDWVNNPFWLHLYLSAVIWHATVQLHLKLMALCSDSFRA